MSSREAERECILLATDFSVPAERAYRYALNLASVFKARLVILTVLKAVPWEGGSAHLHSRQTVRPSVEQVLRRVAQAYGLPVKDVRTGRRGQEGEARKVATYLVKRCCDLTLQETATRLGVGSYGTIAWARHQVRARRAADRRLRRQVERLEHELNQPKA